MHNEMPRFNLPHHKLLKTLQECSTACESTTSMVLGKPDLNLRVNQLRLLRDCADICDLTEDYVARHSPFSKAVATECANICNVCGTECARFPDMESQRCAQICFQCADECRNFTMMR